MVSQPISDAWTSRLLGRYRLVAELGQGGMAEVFLAIVSGPAGFSKLQVIKRLRSHLAEEPEFLTMFLDEARLAAKLNHPNVVQTLEVGEADGQYFIAMEYLDGQPLNRVLRKVAGLTVPMALRLVTDALTGLHHAHELRDFDGTPLNLVHRDVSPHNIFVTYQGQVKLVDFGIAKAATSAAETQTGVLKGKIAYMAPEQARSEPVDRRADVFSVGCCLWEILAGRRLWKGMSDFQVLHAIMGGAEQFPSPRQHNPNVDPRLERICMNALAFDPADRYPSAPDLRDALLAYLEAIRDRTEPSQIGERVAATFAEERERLQEVVREEVARATELRTDEWAAMPVVRFGHASSLSFDSAVGRDDRTPVTGSSGMMRASSLGPVTAAPAPARRSMLPWLALGVTALGGIAGAAVMVEADPPPPPAPVAPAEAPTPAVTAAEPPAIVIAISVRPPEAEIILDGEVVGTGEYSGDHLADGENHHLRLVAEGYQTEEREVRFDGSLSLELVMDEAEDEPEDETKKAPIRFVRPPPKAEPKPEPGDEPESTPFDRRPGATQRPIDDTNPYR